MRRPRTCHASPSWATGHGSSSTPRLPGGCSAVRASASPPWSSRYWPRPGEDSFGGGLVDQAATGGMAALCGARRRGLVELRDALADQLAEQGKTEWARQEFAAELAAEPQPPRAIHGGARPGSTGSATAGPLRSYGNSGWSGQDRARRDISPTKVLADAAIVEAARTMPTGRKRSPASQVSRRIARRHITDWLRAIGRARAQPDLALPSPSAPPARVRRQRTAGRNATLGRQAPDGRQGGRRGARRLP